MYIVWLVISYTASHSILAVGAHHGLPVSERVPDLCVCRGGVGVSVREGKQAATVSRPNAQVKQLTSVTVGCVVVIVNCFCPIATSLWKTKKHFHFNSLSALFMLGETDVLKMKQIYSFGAKNYKN